MTQQPEIPPQVIADFASSHLPVEWQLSGLLQEKPALIRELLEDLLSWIPDDSVHERISNPRFRFFHEHSDGSKQQAEARKEILCGEIAFQINQTRVRLLRQVLPHDRPAPYNHPALRDLPINHENLIDLKTFSDGARNLERNGFIFELCPTLPAVNSSYWLMQNLRPQHAGVSKLIRLDPLSIQPRDKYRGAEYKMWLYGVSLDWSQISSLKEELHGRWMPDDLLGTGVAFTDVAWTPRSDEVHFACEEVPFRDLSHERGSRYLHAVFLPQERHFIHIDGAIRYYSLDELKSRLSSHLRKVGKTGQRVKIFRADGPICTELWGGLVSSFFVWNDDIARYVIGEEEFPSI